MTTFFGSFLDGFTGAGLARKLTIPGEPVLGFAPSSVAFPEIVLSNLRAGLKIYVRDAEIQRRVLEVKLDIKSGNLLVKFESPSGEIKQAQVEGNLPMDLSSVQHGKAT
jgi:hypothetical protein